MVWSAEDSALIQLLLLCNNDKSRLMHWDTRFGTKQLVLLKLHISILVCFFNFLYAKWMFQDTFYTDMHAFI